MTWARVPCRAFEDEFVLERGKEIIVDEFAESSPVMYLRDQPPSCASAGAREEAKCTCLPSSSISLAVIVDFEKNIERRAG